MEPIESLKSDSQDPEDDRESQNSKNSDYQHLKGFQILAKKMKKRIKKFILIHQYLAILVEKYSLNKDQTMIQGCKVFHKTSLKQHEK